MKKHLLVALWAASKHVSAPRIFPYFQDRLKRLSLHSCHLGEDFIPRKIVSILCIKIVVLIWSQARKIALTALTKPIFISAPAVKGIEMVRLVCLHVSEEQLDDTYRHKIWCMGLTISMKIKKTLPNYENRGQSVHGLSVWMYKHKIWCMCLTISTKIKKTLPKKMSRFARKFLGIRRIENASIRYNEIAFEKNDWPLGK